MNALLRGACGLIAALPLSASAQNVPPSRLPTDSEPSIAATAFSENYLMPAVSGMTPLEVPYSGDPGGGNRIWGGAELMVWAIKPGNTPPLVTSGTAASGGALGPGTTTLFGDDLDYGARVSGRFTLGTWLTPSRTCGVEGNFLFMGGPDDNFNASGSGAPGSSVLARPFINAINGLQDSQIVSFPGVTSGTVGVSSGSQLFGAGLNGVWNVCCSDVECCPIDCCHTGNYGIQDGHNVALTAGFRYLNLNEDLVIAENITVLPTAPPPFIPGSTIQVTDRFETRNSFYGGQVGARGEWWREAWFLRLSGNVALGNTHQQVRIAGSTVFTDPAGTSVRQPGGLLALPTNIGSYSRDKFTVVPEVGINVGRQLTDHLRVYVGYNLLYWSSVVRPGDQIDFVVNPTQLPTPAGPGVLVGPARPAFSFRDTDFWAHGVNLGLEFRI